MDGINALKIWQNKLSASKYTGCFSIGYTGSTGHYGHLSPVSPVTLALFHEFQQQILGLAYQHWIFTNKYMNRHENVCALILPIGISMALGEITFLSPSVCAGKKVGKCWLFKLIPTLVLYDAWCLCLSLWTQLPQTPLFSQVMSLATDPQYFPGAD